MIKTILVPFISPSYCLGATYSMVFKSPHFDITSLLVERILKNDSNAPRYSTWWTWSDFLGWRLWVYILNGYNTLNFMEILTLYIMIFTTYIENFGGLNEIYGTFHSREHRYGYAMDVKG